MSVLPDELSLGVWRRVWNRPLCATIEWSQACRIRCRFVGFLLTGFAWILAASEPARSLAACAGCRAALASSALLWARF